MAALKAKGKITLTRPPVAKADKQVRKSKSTNDTFDQNLFALLRRLRKDLADKKRVPPYIIFGDVSLRQMAKDCPTTAKQFLEISGVGDKKLRDYGDVFTETIRTYLASR